MKLWLLVGAVFPTLCHALVVPDLYDADVYVTSESEQQRLSGARAGLLQVLIRVSGNQAVIDSPEIRQALRTPARYYYQFSYRATDREFQVGDEVLPGRILRLSFEPNAIAGLLRQAGFAIWGSNRPSVMLWVAMKDESGRYLMAESDVSELKTAFADLAKERGLPFLYPLLDLEDTAQISEAEVWGAFLDRIVAASNRYAPDSILSGRVQRDASGQWFGKWVVQIDGQWSRMENSASSARELVTEVVDQLADQLASRYAVGSSKSEVQLRVENITTVEDYAGVLSFFESLAPVLDTAVVKVEGEDIELRLSTEGKRQQLIELIELDRKLVLINASRDRLLYRWVAQ